MICEVKEFESFVRVEFTLDYSEVHVTIDRDDCYTELSFYSTTDRHERVDLSLEELNFIAHYIAPIYSTL